MRQEEAYKEAAACAREGMVGSALFAFNSNVDVVLRTDERGALALAHRLGLPVLSECARKGEGAEEVVSTGKMALLLKEKYDERRIGGQAGNMANLAASLGLRSYIHSSVVCRDLTQYLHPGVMVSSPFCFQPAESIMSNGEVPLHFVVDFGKDRYIAVNDMYNTHMLINRNFKRCMEREVRAVERAVVSGFHLLDIPEPRGRVEEVKVLVKRWKGMNRRLGVHLELAHYRRQDVLRAVLEILAPSCDSMGFNELEAQQASDALGMKWKGEGEFMNEMQGTCRSVVLHTKRYAVMAGEGADAGEARLALGHLLAAFRARRGREPGPKELEGLEARPVALPNGVERRFGKGFCLVPALSAGNGPNALGLGDSFSVGYFCAKG